MIVKPMSNEAAIARLPTTCQEKRFVRGVGRDRAGACSWAAACATGAQVLFEGDPLILWQRVLDKVREFVAPVPAVHVVVTSAAPGGLRLSALLTELD